MQEEAQVFFGSTAMELNVDPSWDRWILQTYVRESLPLGRRCGRSVCVMELTRPIP